jgi:hypothetical protein
MKSTTYQEALAMRDTKEAEVSAASTALSAFPRSPTTGLTPDDVKSSPEFRAARSRYHAAARDMRIFNATFLRAYSRAWRETLAARRAARA